MPCLILCLPHTGGTAGGGGSVAGSTQGYARGELEEALRIHTEEELPVYERFGDVRALLVGRANEARRCAWRWPTRGGCGYQRRR